MKRFLSVMLASLAAVPAVLPLFAETAVYAADAPTHQCGENLFWELEDGGETLHISGTGGFNPYCEYGDNNKVYPLINERKNVRRIIIDEGCTALYDSAFRNQNHWWDAVETVSLPESLEIIGAMAFEKCVGLTEITLPPDLKEIGRFAFSMTSLTEVTVPDGVTELPRECFRTYTLEKVQLPPHLVSIGDSCFGSCPLVEMNVPSGLTWIGYHALPTDSEWYQQFADLDYTVLGKVLYDVKEREDGIYAIPDGVETIGPESFQISQTEQESFYIEELTIPDSVTEIIGFPFGGWYYNVSESSGSCVIVGDGLLYKYIGNERVVQIPEGVKHICERAFEYNKTIISVHCPDSLRGIGERAFAYVSVQDLRLNDGLETIGAEAFSHCVMTDIEIPASVTEIGKLMIEAGGTKRIIGTPGTEAEAFAKRNTNSFLQVTEPFNAGYDMTPVYGKDNWSFVNSSANFGSRYYLTDDAKALLLELHAASEEELDNPFGGSCYGLSLTMILAKAGLLAPAAMQKDARNLTDVAPDELPLSVVNYYQYLVNSSEHMINPTTSQTPEMKLLGMIRIAENVKNGEIPLLLSFSFSAGCHAVVGYGTESGSWRWNGMTYNGRILVWDPNIPNGIHDPSCIYYDTETLNFCMPYYNLYYAANQQIAEGKIMSYTNNLTALNAHPYPFPAAENDLNGNGAADIADAVLLCRTLAEQQNGNAAVSADLDGDGLLTLLDLRLLIDQILTR